MRFVDHRRPGPQLAQVAYQPFGIASAPTPPPALGGARPEELRFRDHRHRRDIDICAVFQLGDGDRESGATGDERAPGLEELRLQPVRTQRIEQDLPPPRRLRDDEAAAGMRGEEILKKADRPGRPSVHRQRRRCLRGERDGGAALVLAATVQPHLRIRRQCGEQPLHRNEDLVRGEYGALAVVAPVSRTDPGCPPRTPSPHRGPLR